MAKNTSAGTGRATDGAGNSGGNVANIRERMDVVASCGTKVGVVDHVKGNAIQLTKTDSPDGQHHFLPTSMVERVDTQVHLNRNSEETRREWKSDAAACGVKS